MIFGINSTDSGSDSNGGGKSTVLEGITLALTGETNRDVSKDEFIRDGEDECYIEMDLSNEVGLVNSLTIKRWFFRKKSSKIEIWENGERNKEITSVNEANKRVFELIGLNKEDLLHFFMVGQETNYSFLTANDGDKKDIISRFSDIEFINEKIEKLKLERKSLELELIDNSRLIQKVENKIEFLNDRKNELNDNFEKENNEKIESLKLKISKEKNNKKSKQSEIDDLDLKIKKFNNDLDSLKLEDISELKIKLSKNNKKSKTFEKDIDEAEHTISHLEAIYEGKITCPSCSHEFNPSEDIEVSEIPTLIEQSNNIILELTNQKQVVEQRIKSLNEKIKLNEEIEDKISDLKRKIKRSQTELESLKDDLKSFDKKIKNIESQIEDLKSNSIDSELEKLDSDIKQQKKDFKKIKLEKDVIDLKILDIDFWIYHFGKKGFLTFLTNKSIKSIEGITNSYLKQMNSELQILIDGYTALKTGDIREKINISIIRNGLQVASFNRYSGGEKGRIKLANILGLQHLINLTAKNGGLNFLGLDEVFEGLDRTGQIDVLNILENLKVTSLVITHRNQPIGASNEIFIEKINGISRIVDKNFINLPHEKSIKSKIRKIREQGK
jgi:exonuclease SbcC